MSLTKRATRPFTKSIDEYSLSEVVSQVDTVLQTYDAEVALALARRICKATKAGEWSFDETKLLALYEMADALSKGVPPTADDRDVLRKATAVLGGQPMSKNRTAFALQTLAGSGEAPDILAKGNRIIAAIEGAATAAERDAAESEGKALIEEVDQRRRIEKCLSPNRAQKMGLAPR